MPRKKQHLHLPDKPSICISGFILSCACLFIHLLILFQAGFVSVAYCPAGYKDNLIKQQLAVSAGVQFLHLVDYFIDL